jgi:hypothetical protein
VADEREEVGSWSENYWTLRVEPLPADEEHPPAPGDITIRVAHIAAPKPPPVAAAAAAADASAGGGGGGGGGGDEAAAAAAAAAPAANGGSVGGGGGSGSGWVGGGGSGSGAQAVGAAFGNPFLLRVSAGETVGAVKGRIQAKLGVPPADFAAWKVAFVSIRAAPQYLAGARAARRRASCRCCGCCGCCCCCVCAAWLACVRRSEHTRLRSHPHTTTPAATHTHTHTLAHLHHTPHGRRRGAVEPVPGGAWRGG